MAKDEETTYSPDLSVKHDHDKIDVFGNEGRHNIQYKTLSWQVIETIKICQQ
jgi:hypothetical protein